MKLSSIALLAAMALTSPVVAQDAPKPADRAAQAASTMSVTDPQQFAEMATVSNMFEIESSKLALEKATGDAARAFAQHMIEDHTKAGEEMKAAAAAQGVTIPAALDADHQEKLDQSKGLSGDQFDSQYLSIQLAAHQDAVALFQSYSQGGAEGELKAFAQKTLPTLQAHLEDVSSKVASGGEPAPAN